MSNGHLHLNPSLARVVVLLPLALTILLAKFSVPPFSTMGLGIALPMLLAITLTGLLFGIFRLEFGRFCLYLALAIWVCGAQLTAESFSLPSLCFLLALFFPYVLQVNVERMLALQVKQDVLEIFTNFGVTLAALGCLQYGAQFVVGATYAFPIEHLLPKGVLIENFNYLNVLYYGSATYKANGFFFLEPSFFSQFLAVSLVLELTHKNRMWRVVVHLAAMACTFSGTGVIVLAFGAVTLLITRRRWKLFGVMLGALMVAFLLAETFRLNIFIDRISEFSAVGSSGFERFVAWTFLLEDQFWQNTSKVWGGFGAGSFFGHQQVARYSVMESPFAKIIFEFGIPGMVLYFSFILYCIFSSGMSLPVKVGISVCMMMNGAYSESNTGIILSLLLWPPSSPLTRQRTPAQGRTSVYFRPFYSRQNTQ